MTIAKMYAAGKVRRWHANPVIAETGQTNADHQGGCVRLLLMLHPNPGKNLIRAAAQHDDGEKVTGDPPYTLSRSCPEAYAALSMAEGDARRRIHGFDPLDRLTLEDIRWLKLVDRLEAFCHVAITRPAELAFDGWPDQREQMIAVADSLGVGAAVETLIEAMENRRW